MGDVLEHVEPGDALRREELRRVRPFCCSVAARTSPDCTSWRPALWTWSTAVCRTRRNASVCSGSFCWPRANCSTESCRYLSRSRRSCGRSAPQAVEDPLAVGIVRERVQQVLERQVRMPPRGRLAVRDGQDDFEMLD